MQYRPLCNQEAKGAQSSLPAFECKMGLPFLNFAVCLMKSLKRFNPSTHLDLPRSIHIILTMAGFTSALFACLHVLVAFILTIGAATRVEVDPAGSISTNNRTEEISYDAEFNVLKAQRSKEWAKDDELVDEKLALFRKKNGGKAPNILYILFDDVGFGDLGIPELNAIRGYSTPNINAFARESTRFARFYTEPSCTPTRVAFMTGRQPHRNGMGDTAVDISGFGLASKEKTLAGVLSEANYNTVHIGKWHMGDIKDCWPNFQVKPARNAMSTAFHPF